MQEEQSGVLLEILETLKEVNSSLKKITDYMESGKLSAPIPLYFHKLVSEQEAAMVFRSDGLAARKIKTERANLATLVWKYGKMRLILNGGSIDELEGTQSYSYNTWKDQPYVDADSRNAEAILEKHIKIRKISSGK